MGIGALTAPAGGVLAHQEPADCEQFTDGFLGQPINTITAMAFVVVAVLIVVRRRGEVPDRWIFAGLVAATGIGSVIQHGPHPSWQAFAHDLPLVGLIAFIAVDSYADLRGGRPSHAWWLAPTLALWPTMAVIPAASQFTQVAAAAAAIGLALARAWRRPGTRSSVPGALILLGLGATVGTLSRTGWPLCNPDGLVQGHAAWHVLAALAMWWLAPIMGRHDDRGAAAAIGDAVDPLPDDQSLDAT